MPGVNKVFLVGNVGDDPECGAFQDGKAYANFSVATSEQWKDKITNKKQEKTEWHKCVATGRLAEIIRDYVRKGSTVHVEGKIRTRKWQDQEGNDRYTLEIVVLQMQMLGHPPMRQDEAQTIVDDIPR